MWDVNVKVDTYEFCSRLQKHIFGSEVNDRSAAERCQENQYACSAFCEVEMDNIPATIPLNVNTLWNMARHDEDTTDISAADLFLSFIERSPVYSPLAPYMGNSGYQDIVGMHYDLLVAAGRFITVQETGGDASADNVARIFIDKVTRKAISAKVVKQIVQEITRIRKERGPQEAAQE